MELRGIFRGGFLGAIHPQNNFVRVPVAEKVHAHGQDKGYIHPGAPAQDSPDHDDKSRHDGQQKHGFDSILHMFTPYAAFFPQPGKNAGFNSFFIFRAGFSLNCKVSPRACQ